MIKLEKLALRPQDVIYIGTTAMVTRLHKIFLEVPHFFWIEAATSKYHDRKFINFQWLKPSKISVSYQK